MIVRTVLLASLFLTTSFSATWSEHAAMASRHGQITSTLDKSKADLKKEYEEILKLYDKWSEDKENEEQDLYEEHIETRKNVDKDLKAIHALIKTAKELETQLSEAEAQER